MMKVIIYKNGNTHNIGMLINKGEEKSNIIYCTRNTWNIYTVKNEDYYEYSDELKEKLILEIDDKISEFELEIKKIDNNNYDPGMKESYDFYKEKILNTCANIKDDSRFEDRLKEICRIKKMIFSIPNEEKQEDRKRKGKIMYAIKKLEERKRQLIENLSISKIGEFFNI